MYSGYNALSPITKQQNCFAGLASEPHLDEGKQRTGSTKQRQQAVRNRGQQQQHRRVRFRRLDLR
jgi:hypothetical protein